MSDPNSHVTQLSNGLRQLEIQQADANDDQHAGQTSPTSAVGARGSSRPPIRDGYGFRSSGVNTPNEIKDSRSSPLPDPNGLGWPGAVQKLAPLFSDMYTALIIGFCSLLETSQIHRHASQCH